MAAPSSDFDALYSQAIELFKAFPEYQFKTVTAMLVIMSDKSLSPHFDSIRFFKPHFCLVGWGISHGFSVCCFLQVLLLY